MSLSMTMTREQRASDLGRRAWELLKARGTAVADGLIQYNSAGMTIEDRIIVGTHRLSVATRAGKVLIVEWESSGKFHVLAYIPGLWETRLKHLTRGAL